MFVKILLHLLKCKKYLAELVKWLTHWFVAPAYVGSIPTLRPRLKITPYKIRSFNFKWNPTLKS